MLVIKFSRKGRKKQPFFRIIVLEKSKDPWGDFLEDLGYYNPLTKEKSLNAERIKYWISQGAQSTKSIHNLLVENNIIKGRKVKVVKMSTKRKAKKQDKPVKEDKKQEESKETKEEKQKDKKDLTKE